MEMFLGAAGGAADKKYFGPPWTASAGVNAVAAVCDASPGMAAHADLGLSAWYIETLGLSLMARPPTFYRAETGVLGPQQSRGA